MTRIINPVDTAIYLDMIASKNIFTVVLWSFKTTRLSLLDIERKESLSAMSARRHIVLCEWEVFTILWMMNQWLVQTIITDDGDWITARKHSNIVFFIILRPWLSDFSYCITQQGARLIMLELLRLQTPAWSWGWLGGETAPSDWLRLRLVAQSLHDESHLNEWIIGVLRQS